MTDNRNMLPLCYIMAGNEAVNKALAIQELTDMATRLGVPVPWVLAVSHFETGGTFRQDIRNKATGATGWIQFLPSTAKDIGTTTEALASMTPSEHVRFVEKYYSKWFRSLGKPATFADLASVVFHPAAFGKPGYPVGKKGSKAYEANAGLDRDKDGVVTIEEYASLAAKYLPLYGGQYDSGNRQTSGDTMLNRVRLAATPLDIVAILDEMASDKTMKNALDTIDAKRRVFAHLSEKTMSLVYDDIDYRRLAEDTIRAAYRMQRTFEPTVSDYVKAAQDTIAQAGDMGMGVFSFIARYRIPLMVGTVGIVAASAIYYLKRRVHS